MKPVTVITGRAVPLDRTDVDTDQIIPSDWLKRVERTGFGAGLFSEWRDDRDFVLNHPEFVGATVLVAGHNFGTGSSREHAPWALVAWGIRAILSTSFADIFRSNALKNGLLPIVVESERHRQLFELVRADPDAQLTVDLEAQVVHLPGDEDLPFGVDPFARKMLLAGTDEMGWLLGRSSAIEAYEASHPARVDTRVGAA
jgi:3-isopropylmalate/(R)-2-methylmalate dehydratase small subunit